jgi:putative chitinase
MITINQLYNIMSLGKQSIDPFVVPLNEAMAEFRINSAARQSAFIAQLAHESSELRTLQENLNYSANGLMRTFPKYFNAATAGEYARQPRRIANRVYANRMGNGNEASGDGWKHRGMGPIQLTGKDNHGRCGDALGLDLRNNPELLLEPEVGARAAAWFWSSNGLNELADRGDFRLITKRINGGYNGLEDRLAYWAKAKKYIR